MYFLSAPIFFSMHRYFFRCADIFVDIFSRSTSRKQCDRKVVESDVKTELFKVYCSSCGTPVQESFNYCSACGERLQNKSEEGQKSEPIRSQSRLSSQSIDIKSNKGKRQSLLQTYEQFAKRKPEERRIFQIRILKQRREQNQKHVR